MKITTPEQIKQVREEVAKQFQASPEFVELQAIFAKPPTEQAANDIADILLKNFQKTLSDYSRDDLAYIVAYNLHVEFMKQLVTTLLTKSLI